MTAPEPTPTAEHIDAAAVEFEHVVVGSGYYATNIGTTAACEAEREILTSTDPAVHAAMLDALVRAGVLKRSTQRGTLISGGPSLGTLLDLGGPDRVLCERFASDWREVAP